VTLADLPLAPAPDMRSGALTLGTAGLAHANRAAELIAGLDL
jgi:hypothetical protein